MTGCARHHPKVATRPGRRNLEGGRSDSCIILASADDVIALRVDNIDQLFHTLDPFPFRERDLDREAEEYIVGWARELASDQPIKIVVHFPDNELQANAARGIPKDANTLKHATAFQETISCLGGAYSRTHSYHRGQSGRFNADRIQTMPTWRFYLLLKLRKSSQQVRTYRAGGGLCANSGKSGASEKCHHHS